MRRHFLRRRMSRWRSAAAVPLVRAVQGGCGAEGPAGGSPPAMDDMTQVNFCWIVHKRCCPVR